MDKETGNIKEAPLVYLSGAIANAPDGGAGWRNDIIPHLTTLGYRIYNPVTDQPKATGISRAVLKDQLKSDPDEYQISCSKIVKSDLQALCRANIVVAKLDKYTSAGTYGELTVARMKDIPVFAWVDLPDGIKALPAWAVGCIDHYSLHGLDFYKLIPSATALAGGPSNQLGLPFYETAAWLGNW